MMYQPNTARKKGFTQRLNGGTIEEKVEWGYKHFEQEFRVGDVFEANVAVLLAVRAECGRALSGDVERARCNAQLADLRKVSKARLRLALQWPQLLWPQLLWLDAHILSVGLSVDLR